MPRTTLPRDGLRGVLYEGYYAVRAFLALVLGWWAYVLALPGETFSVSPSYAWFADIGTERGWAVFTGTGAVLLASALFYRATWWRAVSAIVASVAYGVIAYGIWRGHPYSTGTGTYTACAMLCYALAARNVVSSPGALEHRP